MFVLLTEEPPKPEQQQEEQTPAEPEQAQAEETPQTQGMYPYRNWYGFTLYTGYIQTMLGNTLYQTFLGHHCHTSKVPFVLKIYKGLHCAQPGFVGQARLFENQCIVWQQI